MASHQDLHCLPFCFYFFTKTLICYSGHVQIQKMKESSSETPGWRGSGTAAIALQTNASVKTNHNAAITNILHFSEQFYKFMIPDEQFRPFGDFCYPFDHLIRYWMIVLIFALSGVEVTVWVAKLLALPYLYHATQKWLGIMASCWCPCICPFICLSVCHTSIHLFISIFVSRW